MRFASDFLIEGAVQGTKTVSSITQRLACLRSLLTVATSERRPSGDNCIKMYGTFTAFYAAYAPFVRFMA